MKIIDLVRSTPLYNIWCYTVVTAKSINMLYKVKGVTLTSEIKQTYFGFGFSSVWLKKEEYVTRLDVS